MRIEYIPPPAAALSNLLGTITKRQAEQIVKLATLFVCLYDNDDFVGVTWAVGDGQSWLVPYIFIAGSHRGQGHGQTIRREMIEACEKETVKLGTMYGFYSSGISRGFWEKVPGVKSMRGYTGVRRIQGRK